MPIKLRVMRASIYTPFSLLGCILSLEVPEMYHKFSIGLLLIKNWFIL